VAAINTDGPAMPAPPAASTPMEKIRPAVVVIHGVMTVPAAINSMPTISTRPAPILSATAPANGCVRPHHNCPNANARLMLPIPRPVALFNGLRKSPIVWRVPIVMANAPPAASRTSQAAFFWWTAIIVHAIAYK